MDLGTPEFEPSTNGYPKTGLNIESRLRQSGKESRFLLVGLLTILNSASPLCLAGSQQGKKGVPYDFVTVVFLTECCKFIFAVAFFLQETLHGLKVQDAKRNEFTWGMFLLFGIPALLYSFDNNFQYIILWFLKPAELTILWNFKIVMTALLMRVFLGQNQTSRQWLALACLIFGCFLTQANSLLKINVTSDIGTEGEATRKLWGMALAFLGSTVMATGNVFTEWLFKRRPEDSIYLQNMQLYFFGICMNLMVLVGKMMSTPDSPVHEGFFTGYNGWTWCLLLAGSLYGIVISFTLKFVDNIAVVFSHALAMLAVTTISAAFFDLQVSLEFVIGVMVVATSTVAYYVNDKEVFSSCLLSERLIRVT